MAFNWKEFLDLAIALQTGRSDYPHDAALRSAVSRAYYAAYCIARDYARDKEGLSLANMPSDHSLVRRHYLRHGRDDLASELDDLRQWRNVCDYEEVINPPHSCKIPSPHTPSTSSSYSPEGSA
jgi:hypothetical protein